MSLTFEPKIFPIESLVDYITQIERSTTTDYLFRGESDYFEHNFMRGKALRSASNALTAPIKDPLDISFKMIRDFYRQVSHRISETERKNFTAFAQHYGVPTNLLDVTNSPLVALYFACLPRALGKQASVWRKDYLQNKPFLSKTFDYGFVYTFDKYVDITDLLSTMPTNINFIEHIFLSESDNLKKFFTLMLRVKLEKADLFAELLKNVANCYIYHSSNYFSKTQSKDELLELLYDNIQLAYYELLNRDSSLNFVIDRQEDYDVALYCALSAYIFRQTKKHLWCMWNIDFLPNFLYRPECSFDRIKNQHGQFFYQASLSLVDDLFDCSQHSIQRIAVGPVMFEIHNKRKMLQSLDRIGINSMTIMNDFDSIAQYVCSKYSSK